jgi:di/tricarboxylate transporter
MPAIVLASWGVGGSPSGFLIPGAFAANVGGLLTLAGTPPNIVVADALEAAGFRPFGFFEFSLIAIPLLIVAIVYMATIGRRLLPKSRTSIAPPAIDEEMEELAALYSLDDNLYRMRVRKPSPLIGQSLRESDIRKRFGVAVLQIEQHRDEPNVLGQPMPSPVRERMESMMADPPALPDADQTILFDDVLIVTGTPAQVHDLSVTMRLGMLPIDDAGHELSDLLSQEIGIAEVLLTPRSSYAGTVVADGTIAHTFGVLILGIRRGDKLIDTSAPLKFGDALLVRGTWDAIGSMAEEKRNFVVVGQPEAIASQVIELNSKSWISIAILAAMVVMMVTSVVPVVIASMLAAGAMLLTGCLTRTQAYRAISWSTVILIAAMIPMAIALEQTGGAQKIADGLVDTLGSIGAVPLLAGVFLVTAVFSQVISNTAATVLMAPIVLSAAAGLGVSPYPLMMGLAVAASSAFLTPIGTAPNLMVMAPGGYTFNDYMKVGAPLLAAFFALSLVLIPIFWPF